MKRKLQINIQNMNPKTYVCSLITNKDGVTRDYIIILNFTKINRWLLLKSETNTYNQKKKIKSDITIILLLLKFNILYFTL
ncbi:hypothetical protein SAMN06295933_1641 [Desulfovibrio gilichinskyi]|uniref:Uncharacterized protein n=1 Tax=Desulfovibrio gilichinskyi TaxID=1519643 RepID=A0A1X7D4E2_9BACT|nr:hypothetical protein SAMN06295933_1641 [Desulfovibrio gilichinskyi]